MVEFLFHMFQSYYDTRVPLRYRHETEEAKDARLMDLATALVSECKKHPLDARLGWTLESCVALGATTAKWESGLLQDVHSGKRVGPSGERCLFQLHQGGVSVPDARYRVTHEEWLELTGTGPEATARCVAAGVKTLGWHIHRCSIHFEGGDRFPAAELFAEYHVPDVNCHRMPNAMNMARANGYATLLKEIRASEKDAAAATVAVTGSSE